MSKNLLVVDTLYITAQHSTEQQQSTTEQHINNTSTSTTTTTTTNTNTDTNTNINIDNNGGTAVSCC